MKTGEKKEQLPEEFARMQKDIREKGEAQEFFINRLRLLTENAGLFSDVFDNLPFPMALFKKDGELRMVNRALIAATGITADEISTGKINLLSRITDENYSVLEAAEDTFLGKTTLLKKLVYPLAMFCRDDNRVVSKAYKSAIFFPIIDVNGKITTSAMMLMK